MNIHIEEHREFISNEFKEKILFYLHKGLILNAMMSCFDLAIQEIQGIKDYKFKNKVISFANLKCIYLNDEKFYENKYFDLAEQFYKFLKLTDFDESFEFCRKNYKNKSILALVLSENIFHFKEYLYFERNFHDQFKEYLYFIEFISREIEIKFKDSNENLKFRKIYYFKSPRSFMLNDSIKNKFLEKAPRNSIREKLDFFNKKLDFMLLMFNFEYKNKHSYWNFIGYIYAFLDHLDIFNFVISLLVNLYLIFYIYENKNILLEEDLNSQIFLYPKSMLIDDKSINIIQLISGISCLQILFLFFWNFKNYNVMNMKFYFKVINKNNYLFQEINFNKEKTKNFFNVYYRMRKRYSNLNDDYFDLSKNRKNQLNFFFIKLKNLIWNKEIKFVLFSLFCNISFLITKYTLLLVLPILSIIKLYALFGFFLKAIFRKYKEFIALLIFIYVIEYIFSWITYLHF